MLAQKYFRKAGVPARLKRVEENDVPSFLWRSVPDEAALEALPAAERYVSEISARQVFDRLAGAWAYWGWKGGYFDGEDDARAYYDEMRFMLARQLARAQFAAMVQHRPALGLWHRWAGAGPLLRRLADGRADGVDRPPTSIRSRTPVSSSRSPTTSSTRAASWTSGCARRACSNMAPAPAPTSRRCAARTRSSRAAGAPPA